MFDDKEKQVLIKQTKIKQDYLMWLSLKTSPQLEETGFQKRAHQVTLNNYEKRNMMSW